MYFKHAVLLGLVLWALTKQASAQLPKNEGSLLRIRRQSLPSNRSSGAPSPDCEKTEFKCRNGQCISMAFLCDGTIDCLDWSDEKGCAGCKGDEFRCYDGSCINRTKRCDGKVDCPHAADEMDHCCKYNEFQCNTFVCISSALQCNHKSDCTDGSDEYGCFLPPPKDSFNGTMMFLATPKHLCVLWIFLVTLVLSLS